MTVTAICETYFTYYDTMMFIDYCLNTHKDKVSEELKKVADDTEREWGKQNFDEKSAEYGEQGYVSISMKNDFAEIYDKGITKAEKQYVE